MPFQKMIDVLPRDVIHIAHDEHRAHYVAYRADGSVYGTFPADNTTHRNAIRGSSSCDNEPRVSDLEKLPGWGKIIAYADDQWGTKSRKIEVNPKNFKDRAPASICIQDTPSEVKLNAQPTCQTNRVDAQGGAVGSGLTWNNAITQGHSQQASVTATAETSFKLGTSFSASLSIPILSKGGSVSAGPSITVSGEFRNSKTESTTFTLDQTNKQELTLNATAGKHCSATVESTTCSATGHGRMRILAKGWVWFVYRKKTKSRYDPTQSHWNWAVNVDRLLSLPERSSEVPYQVTLNSDSRGNIRAKCV
ncbi:hypothetical protein BD779DRAFT_1669730 [Infundibulicybe gibba]|nr:hypothetical protein BD779DRAFT_1669730 [Infundibulicybe gibba]